MDFDNQPTDYYNDRSVGTDQPVETPLGEILTRALQNKPSYKFNEGELIEQLKSYIDGTYSEHYAVGKLQATEFIIDIGDGLGFTRGNVIKYAKRYGQKAGYNRADLMKVLHYALMLLHVHDLNATKE